MKKYDAPKIQMISRGDLDIICTSDLMQFPIITMGEGEE